MPEPLLILDPANPLPPYEQIGMQLRLQIVAQRLPPDAPLPSVRQLARDLGVAPNTVARAYSELEREGWVVTSLRRGVAVAARPPVAEARARELQVAVARLLAVTRQLGVGAAELHAEVDRQMARSDDVARGADPAQRQ